ncbi:hypothetical protein Hdeb2414_s0006g00220221 [Helianthus debilis subsp. tardiflorus]
MIIILISRSRAELWLVLSDVEVSSSRAFSSLKVVLKIVRAESSQARALGFTREPSSSSKK